jgi:hypothetical protein
MAELCGAKTKSKAGTCQKAKGWGTDHLGVGRCKFHGGASPQAQVAGVVELARREAIVMGQPIDIDPHEAILQAVRIAWGEVTYCSERIADLDTAVVQPLAEKTRPLSHGKDGESSSETVTEVTTSRDAKLHIWVEARHAALDRAVTYSKIALAAGIEERKVRIAEAEAQLLAEAFKEFAKAMGHNPADPQVRAAMRHGLTVVAGGRAA